MNQSFKNHYLIVHPNVLMKDNAGVAQNHFSTIQTAQVEPDQQLAGFSRNPQPSSGGLQHPRSYKMRVDYQSKINCMPNSLTLQLEGDSKVKRRPKSTLNVRKDLHSSANFFSVPKQDTSDGHDYRDSLATYNADRNAVQLNQRRRNSKSG